MNPVQQLLQSRFKTGLFMSTMIRLTQKLTFRLTLKTLIYEKEAGIAHTIAKSQISTATIAVKRVARLPLP